MIEASYSIIPRLTMQTLMKLLSILFFLPLLNAFADETLLPIEVLAPSEKSNTIQILQSKPGVSFQSGGGISALPIIHGMSSDRVNIKIDGAQITASCPNHMNPALSYVDLEKIEEIEIFAGITPVSYGGDSLGGSIVVKTKELKFASSSEELVQLLQLKTFYRSNNENRGASLQYALASEKNYVSYEGLDERANNYRDGSGKRLKSTLYQRNNQSLTVGRKLAQGVASLKYMHTIVPYEGFINQRMDMENNVSNHLTATYKGSLGKLSLDSSVYYQHTNHYMDYISSQRDGEMPMYTRSDEAGYNLKFFYELNSQHLLSFGSDYNRYRLDDWWPALPDVTYIMGPGTFKSINQGQRDRLGFYVEGESSWSQSFATTLGVRTDFVKMNTGSVHGYNGSDNLPADAEAFNAQNKEKTDHNVDATLTSKLKLNQNWDVELGLARKSRSPNLYERYAWAGAVTDPTDMMDMSSMGASMDMLMINWFGDGNGYVGNIDLKPEVAHKISASLVGHDENQKDWEIRLSPYYSDIQSFIDADLIGTNMGAHYLRFANHDAVVLGADLSGSIKWNATSLNVIASYTRGYRKDGKAELYHLMPLNGKVILKQDYECWGGEFIAHLVDKKEQVNEMRGEPTTPGYALFDVGLSFKLMPNVKLNFGVSNLLDHHYALPLGGVDLANELVSSRTPVRGMGRSYSLGLNWDLL